MKIRPIIQSNKGRWESGPIDRLRSNHLIGGYSIEYSWAPRYQMKYLALVLCTWIQILSPVLNRAESPPGPQLTFSDLVCWLTLDGKSHGEVGILSSSTFSRSCTAHSLTTLHFIVVAAWDCVYPPCYALQYKDQLEQKQCSNSQWGFLVWARIQESRSKLQVTVTNPVLYHWRIPKLAIFVYF